MSLWFKEKAGRGVVAVWKIDESSDQFLKVLNLTEDDQNRVNDFKLESRKQEFLAVRRLIKEVLNIDPVINYLPSGKPVLTNCKYNLSISHTKGFAAVVLSEDEKIGIDIEIASDRILNVSSRFISQDEEAFILNDQRLLYYTLIWCLKETMFKIYDQPGILFNRHFEVKKFQLKEQQGCFLGVFNKDFEECLKYNYKVLNSFCLVYRC